MDGSLLAWCSLVASWNEPEVGGHSLGHRLKIEDYLVTPLGLVGGSYNPTQLIKWLANKEGIAHLDFRKPKTLQQLKQTILHTSDGDLREFEVKRAVQQLGAWAITAIDYLLSGSET